MKKTFITAAALIGLGLTSLTAQKKNVILYIGDGFGIAPKTAARMALGQGTPTKRFSTDANFHALALDNLKYSGMVTTHSLNSWITDSAPGAAVYAAGQKGKIDNEVLSLDPNSNFSAIETILENAKKNGYAVGLVSTARITHATPAAFASHIWHRDLENYIAAQFVTSSQEEYEALFNSSPKESWKYNATRDWVLPEPKRGVELDVILGGGAQFFLTKNKLAPNAQVVDASGAAIKDASGKAVVFSGNRVDSVDVVEYAKTVKKYTYVNSRDALNNIDLSKFTETDGKLLGLFHNSHVNYELDRQLSAPWEPSIEEMTNAAIKGLQKKSPKGFFLMVEAGRIDHLAHANSGGVTVIAGTPKQQYTVDSDKPSYVGGGEAIYGATDSTKRLQNVYGSDYMIHEVIAYDYAIAAGKNFMNGANGNTLILSTSDHECGGFAVVALHDEADAQKNGTKIRTYAGAVSKSGESKPTTATPVSIVRGDGGDNGWYPEYVMEEFQGKNYPMPKSATGKRIVIAYGSNPLTNGNGKNAGGTPGNHTPQDILVLGDDNVGGTFASKITGRGLLDNTDLTPIMSEFLNLTDFVTAVSNPLTADKNSEAVTAFPVPFSSVVTIGFDLVTSGEVTVELYNAIGVYVQTVVKNKPAVAGHNEVTVQGNSLPSGEYIALITNANGTALSKKVIKF